MPTVMVVDDEKDVQYSFQRLLEGTDVRVICASSGEEALGKMEKTSIDLVLMDVRMGGLSGLDALKRMKERYPKVPVIIMTAYGTTDTAIESMKYGAFDYVQKPFDILKIKAMIKSALEISRSMKELVRLPSIEGWKETGEAIVGNSEAMQEIYKRIGQVAPTDATVLITGERGTGKELVARAIYHHSKRSNKPYLPINCAAIPLELLESELFGHERGAFTGAYHRRIGKLEQCQGGTVFLDEIGDMSVATQAKLLRVLQERTFERIGGNERVQVDVRFIVATNRNLESLVGEGKFRADLYDRLNVVRIHLPPLRDRKEDIPLLVKYFLGRFGNKVRGISRKALHILMEHDWPGNVRELQNVIERAVILARGDTLDERDIELSYRETPQTLESQTRKLQEHLRVLFQMGKSLGGGINILREMEREFIRQALEETRGNQTRAAKMLGMNRNTLRNKMRAYGLDKNP